MFSNNRNLWLSHQHVEYRERKKERQLLIRAAADVDGKLRESCLIIFPFSFIINQLPVWLMNSLRFFIFNEENLNRMHILIHFP